MSTVNTVSVHILDKEYQVACPEDQQAELIISARYLDKQMRAIRDTGKVIGLERIAVMAALNISHELLKAS
ncbi:MAG TPA: cell division protein ZapA, partial [Halieaceae bacterium]|nr:cell division protein ZapA [Halieaceae bacterium]